MKITRLLSSIIVASVVMVASAGVASAQAGVVAPSNQAGIGIYAGGGGTSAGLTVQYAFSPAIQAGVDLGLVMASDDARSNTDYAFGPYVRWIFEGTVNPFIQAGFRVTGSSTKLEGATESTSTDANQIYGGFGLVWYQSRTVGMYAMGEVIQLNLDPSQTSVGIFSGRAGIELFFAQ